jgi:hypothetical protein
MSATEPEPQPARKKRPKNRHWGLFTMVFLGLAVAALIASNTQGRYTGLTLAMLFVGLAGAATCTVKGLKQNFGDGRGRSWPF